MSLRSSRVNLTSRGSSTSFRPSNVELNRSTKSTFSTWRPTTSFKPSLRSPSFLCNTTRVVPLSVRCLPQLAFFASGAGKVVQVPGMGDSISEGVIKKWHKKEGDFVNVDDMLVSIETDKVVVEIRAQEAGKITKLFSKEEDTVKVGADLYELDTSSKPPAKAAAAPETPKPAPPKAEAAKAAAPTPAPAQAPSPTPAKAPSSTPAPAAKAPSPTPAASTADVSGQPREYRVKMSRLRMRVAERLKDSQNTYALLTTFQECDMTRITELRNEYKDVFEKKHGVKLGFMSVFVKASAQALVENPIVNAVIDGEHIVYRNFVDISVAVATPTGLVVPVLRNCEKLSFAGVEKEIAALGKKARDGQIQLEDMAGGTFTISNGGVYGSMMGTPIVNPPQSAILGMHAINKRAMVVNDKIEIRPMMYLALTYDHRLIDGKDAVTFLRRIKEIVEDPKRLLLDI